MERTVDVRGMKCPLPVLRAARELAFLEPGDVLVVLATDPASVPDMDAWAKVDERVVLVEQQSKRDDHGKELFVHRLRRK